MGVGILRNKSCLCGSGKKFKKCCLNKKEESLIVKCNHDIDMQTGFCKKCKSQITDMIL